MLHNLESQWERVNQSLMKGSAPSEAWDPLQPTPSKRAAEHAALEVLSRFGGAVHATGVNSEDDEGPGDGVGRPVAVHCAPGRALERAKHVARWVVINKNDPHGAMGKEVGHLDEVMLEQVNPKIVETAPESTRRAGSG